MPLSASAGTGPPAGGAGGEVISGASGSAGGGPGGAFPPQLRLDERDLGFALAGQSPLEALVSDEREHAVGVLREVDRPDAEEDRSEIRGGGEVVERTRTAAEPAEEGGRACERESTKERAARSTHPEGDGHRECDEAEQRREVALRGGAVDHGEASAAEAGDRGGEREHRDLVLRRADPGRARADVAAPHGEQAPAA